MTDEWFEEYVFQIVAPREFVDRDLLAIYDHAPHSVKVLPMWDTLGESSADCLRLTRVLMGRVGGSRLLRLDGVSQQTRRLRKAFGLLSPTLRAYIATLSRRHFLGFLCNGHFPFARYRSYLDGNRLWFMVQAQPQLAVASPPATHTMTRDKQPTGIARLTAEKSTYAYFRSAHLVPNTPCLFPPSYSEDWPIRRNIASDAGELDYTYLEQIYGPMDVTCIDCEASTSKLSESEEEEPPVATFRDLLELWRRGRGRTRYLKDWHLPLAVHRSGEGRGEGAAANGKGKERVREELYDVPPAWLDDWMNEYEGSEREDDFRFVVRQRLALVSFSRPAH